MPSYSLIVPTRISTRPRLAYPKSSRGALVCNILILFYYLLLSYLKTYIYISLYNLINTYKDIFIFNSL